MDKLSIELIEKELFPNLGLMVAIRFGMTCKQNWIFYTHSKQFEKWKYFRNNRDCLSILLYVGKWGDEELIDYLLLHGYSIDSFLVWGLASCAHLSLLRKYFPQDSQDDQVISAMQIGGMYGAARSGSAQMINYMIDRGVQRWDQGLCGASKIGDIKWMEFFIAKGACDFNFALRVASESGSIQTIEYLLSHPKFTNPDYSFILNGVCKGGKINLISYALQKLNTVDWPAAMFNAAWGRRKELIDYVIQNYDNNNDTIYSGLLGAALIGDEELFNFFLSKIKYTWSLDWENIYAYACVGNEKLAQKIREQYPINNLRKAMDKAAAWGLTKLFKKLLQENPSGLSVSSQFASAVGSGQLELIKFLKTWRPTNARDALYEANKNQNYYVLPWL